MYPFSRCFNLKRDASPLAMMSYLPLTSKHTSFNLKRDASPLALCLVGCLWLGLTVSISSEMPAP